MKVVYLRGGVFDSSDLSILIGDGVLDRVVGDARFLSFTERNMIRTRILSILHVFASFYDFPGFSRRFKPFHPE